MKDGFLEINPSISNQWKEYSVRLKFGEYLYNIRVKNEYGNNTIKKVVFNGNEIKNNKIKLFGVDKINEIEIILN